MTAHQLLDDLGKQGINLRPLPGGKLEIRPASRLTEPLREELRRRKAELLSFLHTRDFLSRHVPEPGLEIFPDWTGLLITSSVLEMTLWVVRSRQEGEEIAQETGHPALLLDDVLSQQGHTREEARAALLPILITGRMQ